MKYNGLEITDVIVFPLKGNSEDKNLRAFAKIILNDQFVVQAIKIYKGHYGHFIRMPQEYNKSAKTNLDSCFTISSELKKYITDTILKEYANSLKA